MPTLETLRSPGLISSATERPMAICMTLFDPRKNLTIKIIR